MAFVDDTLGVLVRRRLLHKGGEREAERRGEREMAVHSVARPNAHLFDAPLVRRDITWYKRGTSYGSWWFVAGKVTCTTRTLHCICSILCRHRYSTCSPSKSIAITPGNEPDGEERERDAEHCAEDGEPELPVERLHEGEHAGLLDLRLLEHDADAEAHERLGEVDEALALGGDGERRHHDVSAPLIQLAHEAIVRPRFVHELPVEARRVDRHVPACDTFEP